MDMQPGAFVDVETGLTQGTHRGIAAYTCGQRACISGQPEPWCVLC